MWDADEDRMYDSLSSVINGTFITSLKETYSIGISVIYGYSLFMLIGIISVITMLLNSKRKQNQNK